MTHVLQQTCQHVHDITQAHSPCVMSIQLLLPFLSCEDYMLSIFDDNNIPNIKVWSKLHLVLALRKVANNPKERVVHGSKAAIV